MSKVKEKKVTLIVSFIVDENHEDTDDFLCYAEAYVGEGIIKEECVLTEEVNVGILKGDKIELLSHNILDVPSVPLSYIDSI